MAAASLIGYKNARHPSSNPGKPSIAKSTLTGALYIPGRDKRLVFASEWLFKPEGIRAVKIKFQDALKQNALIADYEWDNQDMVFRVRCIVGDTPKVSAIFSGILTGIICEAHGDDYLSDDDDEVQIMVTNSEGEDVLFASDKIERLSAWKKRHGITEQKIQSEVATPATDIPARDAYPTESTGEPGPSDRELIWSCEGTDLHMDDIASDDVLTILKDLTGCNFTKDLNQGKLIISHSSAENRQRALRKLNNLKQKYLEPMSPYITHIFYAESVPKYQLRPYRFIQVKKKFFKSTFLNPYTIGMLLGYQKLSRATTIRCASWNELNSTYTPVPVQKIIPATDLLDVTLNSKDLLHFGYCSKGKIENHPLRHFVGDDDRQGTGVETRPNTLPRVDSGNIEQTKHNRIEGWAQEIVGETLTDGIQDREQVNVSSNLTRLGSSAAKELEGLTLSSSFDEQYDLIKSETALRAQSDASNVGSLLDEDMPGMSFAPLVPLRAWSATLPPASPEPPKIAGSSIRQGIAAQPPDDSLSARQAYRKPPRVQQKFPPTMGQATPNFNLEDQRRAMSPSTIKLSSVRPVTQNQRPNVGIQHMAQNPTPEFLKEVKTRFRELMTGLQGFPGEVVVQAEIGRIILRKVKSQFITSDDNAESFSQKDVLAQLLPGSERANSHVQTLFTNILTTLPSDISYLVSIKGQSDRAMWQQTAAESSVVYEISCHNEALAGYNPFTIEINGETFDTRIKTRYDFGAINVHGILRHWDFRMVAFGFGDDEENEKLYGDFARAIQRSLYIPPDLSKPCLFFELDNSFIEKSKLLIDSILVHHVAKYKSTDSGATSVLKISKIVALNVDSMCPFQGANFQIYKAEPPPPGCQQEPGALNIWHEASISSSKGNEELKGNTTMELGDEADWTPEKLDELGVARDMCIPAGEMLKQMDGVGINNDNGAPMDTLVRETSPPKRYVFW